jgi:hypothetical protein
MAQHRRISNVGVHSNHTDLRVATSHRRPSLAPTVPNAISGSIGFQAVVHPLRGLLHLRCDWGCVRCTIPRTYLANSSIAQHLFVVRSRAFRCCLPYTAWLWWVDPHHRLSRVEVTISHIQYLSRPGSSLALKAYVIPSGCLFLRLKVVYRRICSRLYGVEVEVHHAHQLRYLASRRFEHRHEYASAPSIIPYHT